VLTFFAKTTLNKIYNNKPNYSNMYAYIPFFIMLIISVFPANAVFAQSEDTATSFESDTLITPATEEREIKNESWHAIQFRGKKVGSMHSIFSEVTSIPEDEVAVRKTYQFSREITLDIPVTATGKDALPLTYQRLTEETSFEAESLTFQSLYIKITFADKREITIRGEMAENKVKIDTTTKITPTDLVNPPPVKSEFIPKKNFFSEQLIGMAILRNNWEPGQSSSIQLIGQFIPGTYFTDAVFLIKDKSTQEIMGKPVDGYNCSLTFQDKSGGQKAVEYFYGLDGILQKQIIEGGLVIIKTTQDQASSGTEARLYFVRNGRPDPFISTMTFIRNTKSSIVETPGDRSPTKPDQVWGPFIKQAEEYLKEMKDLYEKTTEEKRPEVLAPYYYKILDIYNKIDASNDEEAKKKITVIREQADKYFAGVEKIYTQATYIAEEAK